MRVALWMRLLAVAVLVVAAAACGGDDDDDSDAGATTTTTGETTTSGGDDGGDATSLTITATDYEFEIDDEIEGGIVEVTLANEGEQVHEAGFFEVDADYELSQFSADFGSVTEGGPIPEAFETATGVGDTEGGQESTSTITLPEGDYVLFCSLTDEDGGDEGADGGDEPEGAGEGEEDAATGEEDAEGGEEEPTDGPPPHYELGMLTMVSVTGGADADASAIESDGVVEAFDYGFEVPDLEAGEHTLTLENTSTEQFHHAIVFGFPEGVDEQGARDAFEALIASEGPPPEGTPEPDEVGFSYVFGPGMGGTFDVELESGRTYAMVCFIQDREGGPPHAVAHEMVEIFAVE